MEYLAVLGRQPEISVAELEALFGKVWRIAPNLAAFCAFEGFNIRRLGGTIKLATPILVEPKYYFDEFPEGKLTVGLSDYSEGATLKSVQRELMGYKRMLTQQGRSMRVIESQTPIVSTATSLHNGLAGDNPRKMELIKYNDKYYRVVGVQDIDAYARRDQARPARDAKVGMLPPKLAQILINLCGDMPMLSCILDPFCGTGTLLQEAMLMGYQAYGTDIDPRMVRYAKKNIEWYGGEYLNKAMRSARLSAEEKTVALITSAASWATVADATTATWQQPIAAVACECYLGAPMSQPPTETQLKIEQLHCQTLIMRFLRNLAPQIEPGTPVVMAIPAWLRPDHTYSRLKILDEISKLGYNVDNKSREGLLYHRDGQVVARDIIILRK